MKKILLPTDFSYNAWNAIKFALQLFENEKCNFFLLNTYTPMIYNMDFMETRAANFELIDVIKETSEKNLDKTLSNIHKEFKNKKHTFTKISSFNMLTNEIEELTKGNVIDFIVMGTKGATDLIDVLLGSNTIHVIKTAKCPVLAIPSNYTFKEPKEILFPSDFEVTFKEKHVNPILNIAKTFASKVHVLNVSIGYNLSENQKINKQQLKTNFKGITSLFHSVSNDSVTEAITNFQLKNPINLLVMLNNKHSFFENLFFTSKIKKIGFHIKVPFLIIPVKY